MTEMSWYPATIKSVEEYETVRAYFVIDDRKVAIEGNVFVDSDGDMAMPTSFGGSRKLCTAHRIERFKQDQQLPANISSVIEVYRLDDGYSKIDLPTHGVRVNDFSWLIDGEIVPDEAIELWVPGCVVIDDTED